MIQDTYQLDRLPWEQQPNEPQKAYAAFIAYRDLGFKRTLRKATIRYFDIQEDQFAAHSGSIRNVERWSARWRWVARVEAWDRHVQAELDADNLDAIKAMYARHANLATVMQNMIAQKLQSVGPTEISLMGWDQLTRLYDIAVKNERLARGVPDRISAVTNADGGPLEVVEVSPDVLERKFAAWVASKDVDNSIESGEPPVEPSELDDLLPDVPAAPKPSWPKPEIRNLIADDGEPFPDTAGEVDDEG